MQNSGLERTERLLNLVPFLATHQGISIEELAREFSVTTSQLTEDLTTLWMCGLPGYTALELMDLSFDTGFVSISNADTLARPRVLNRDEVLTLILGLEALQEDADPTHGDLAETIAQLVKKLIGFLDLSFDQKVQAGTTALSFERGVIEGAIAARGAVQISYHSISRDELSTRVIHPLEFTFSSDSEYVFAFCESTKSYRTFRLDRITDALPVANPKEIAPQEISPTEGEKFPMSVTIGSRLRDVAERFNLEIATDDPAVPQVLHLESFTADWAIREIMSFGGEVALKSPQELRNSLRERSMRALKAYKA